DTRHSQSKGYAADELKNYRRRLYEEVERRLSGGHAQALPAAEPPRQAAKRVGRSLGTLLRPRDELHAELEQLSTRIDKAIQQLATNVGRYVRGSSDDDGALLGVIGGSADDSHRRGLVHVGRSGNTPFPKARPRIMLRRSTYGGVGLGFESDSGEGARAGTQDTEAACAGEEDDPGAG
ncbi:MAG: hypothetical protein GY842_13195, partial [bacterium]|nr:hypothetical protein [bacterium]